MDNISLEKPSYKETELVYFNELLENMLNMDAIDFKIETRGLDGVINAIVNHTLFKVDTLTLEETHNLGALVYNIVTNQPLDSVVSENDYVRTPEKRNVYHLNGIPLQLIYKYKPLLPEGYAIYIRLIKF